MINLHNRIIIIFIKNKDITIKKYFLLITATLAFLKNNGDTITQKTKYSFSSFTRLGGKYFVINTKSQDQKDKTEDLYDEKCIEFNSGYPCVYIRNGIKNVTPDMKEIFLYCILNFYRSQHYEEPIKILGKKENIDYIHNLCQTGIITSTGSFVEDNQYQITFSLKDTLSNLKTEESFPSSIKDFNAAFSSSLNPSEDILNAPVDAFQWKNVIKPALSHKK